MKAGVWASVGSVAMAATSSACCWLPLVAVGLGLGAGGAAAMLERYRGVFLGAATVLLGIGFYFNYRRDPRCAPDGTCLPEHSALTTANRIVLWVSAVVVVLFSLFPQIRAAFPAGGRSTPAVALVDLTSVVLDVGGMTCATCEEPVERALRTVQGVRAVHADAASGHVTLILSGESAPDNSLLRSKLRSAGYELFRREPGKAFPHRSLGRLSTDGRELREMFNRDNKSARIIAFLSPT